MKFSTLATLFNLALLTTAIALPQDAAAGSQNVGNGEGKQFITGACDSNADCASACCASGLCSAKAVAAAKGGCGFVAAGAAAGNSTAAATPAAAPAPATSAAVAGGAADNAAGSANVGNGEGKQFITGQCDSDADCASACCASGLCSAKAVAAAKGGCGFVANKLRRSIELEWGA
ncbi:hypothetical protein MMC20_002795 [Loxospora ochrophaea]|nr:hypothetical protein [Loxospora ochrophaea]